MFEELLILTSVVLGVTFVRLARRMEAGQRGYLVAVSVVLGFALAALARDSRFLGVMAMSFTVLIVVFPWALESGARAAFGRGRLQLAVMMAGVRALLMPGAGLSRPQEILRGLAMLEREGVDRALEHFRHLADDTDEGGELALINEQIVAMLLYGQRWDESIAHYEARFHPRYAALRPALALGLLRAYGESGHMDRAAGLLRALEEGPVGADPRAAGLLSQARLTFLAYAGATRTVLPALSEERREQMGFSAASGALFRGIAHLHAGQASEAQRELATVEGLAGSADDRVVDASRSAIAKLDGHADPHAPAAPADLGPDLRRYVDGVGDRLDAFLRASPTASRVLPRAGAPICVIGALLGYLVFLGLDRGGYGLVDLGALVPSLWRSGQWFRLATGIWLHADPIATLLNVYALWLAAPLFERLHGTGRLLLAAGGGGTLGLLAAAVFTPNSVAIMSGANLMVMAVVAGATWSVLPIHGARVGTRAGRSLLIPLLLVFAAQLLCLIPGLLALELPPAALALAAGVGVLVAMIPPRGVGRFVGALAIPVVLFHLVALGFAFVAARDGRTVLAEPAMVTVNGQVWSLPNAFEPVTEARELHGGAMPLLPGAVDAVALRGGVVVQVLGPFPDGPDPSAREPLVMMADPALRHELTVVPDTTLPPQMQAAWSAVADPGVLEVFALRRNGDEVGLVVQRREGGRVWGVVASPPIALEHAAGVYAAILAGPGPKR